MAIKLPTYERHVQLDAAAQTIPRYQTADYGKAVEKVGKSLMDLSLHWQKKEDAFQHFKMKNAEAQLHQDIQVIIAEESNRFDPSNDPPGTLHDRIAARVKPLVSQYIASAPTKELHDRAVVQGQTYNNGASTQGAMTENKITTGYFKTQLDKTAGAIAKQAESNPEVSEQLWAQMKSEVNKTTLPEEVKKKMLTGYADLIGQGVYKGYVQSGRPDAAKDFGSQWAKDRRDEFGPDTSQAGSRPRTMPGGAMPPAGTTGPRSEAAPEEGATPTPTSLNQNRIAEVEKNPKVAAAIETAAAKYGLDPNMLKVAASLESSGNPNKDSKSGEYKGLFQLSKSEFGMNGGGDIHSAEDNANAFAKMTANRLPQLEQALGHSPSATEVYMAHQQGVGGLLAHLSNPNEPAWKAMLSTDEGQRKGADWAKKAVWGNLPDDVKKQFGSVENVRSADLFNLYDSKVRGGRLDFEKPTPAVTSQENVVVADLEGNVVKATPSAIIGGAQVGTPPVASNLQGNQLQSAGGQPINYVAQPGATYGRYATANQKPFNAIVTHYTGSDNLDSALNTLKGDPSRGGASYGYHFYIDKDGTIYQGAPLDARTNHVKGPFSPMHVAGARTDITNENAIGISFVGSGEHPTQAQIDAGKRLAGQLRNEYNIPAQNVVGHGELQTDRQSNEGSTLASAVRNNEPVTPFQGGKPVQVAQAGGVTLDRWDNWRVNQDSGVDAALLKAQSIQTSMKHKLKSVIDSDVKNTLANGTDVQLSKDLQDYFHTDKLSYEFIANKLGTGDAISWQENKQYATKVHGAIDGMSSMPISAINERIASVKPMDGAPDYASQAKVYKDVLDYGTDIIKNRNNDPAAAADAMPDVAAAKKKAMENPDDPQAQQELVFARMKTQQYLQVPDSLRTPLTTDEAHTLAAPLLDRANADPKAASQAVANGVLKFVGGNPDLAHRALTTVLKVKGINDETANLTAGALVVAQKPPPAPVVPTEPRTWAEKMFGKVDPQKAAANIKDGYYDISGTGMPGTGGPSLGPSDDYADPPDAGFVAGTKFVDPGDITALRRGTKSADEIDASYGPGAARWILDQAGAMTTRHTVPDILAPMPAPSEDDNKDASTPDNPFEPDTQFEPGIP